MDFYVYVWTNSVNGKRYIGKGRGCRVYRHFTISRLETRRSAFYSAIRKYGAKSFFVGFIASGLAESTANSVERAFIAMYGTRAEYNLTDGGEGASGFSHSSETRAKMASSHRGRKKSLEHRQNIGKAQLGKKRSESAKANLAKAQARPEYREKLAAAHRGKKKPPTHREAMSRVRIGKRPGKPEITDAHKINMLFLKTLGASASDIRSWFDCSLSYVYVVLSPLVSLHRDMEVLDIRDKTHRGLRV